MGSLEEWQQYLISEHGLEEYLGTNELMSWVKKSDWRPQGKLPGGGCSIESESLNFSRTWTCSLIVF